MDIVIYSTSSCAECAMLTRWLDQKQQKYIKKITDTDDATMEEFMQQNDGHIGVPFSIVTDNEGNVTKIAGFDRKRFSELLKL